MMKRFISVLLISIIICSLFTDISALADELPEDVFVSDRMPEIEQPDEAASFVEQSEEVLLEDPEIYHEEIYEEENTGQEYNDDNVTEDYDYSDDDQYNEEEYFSEEDPEEYPEEDDDETDVSSESVDRRGTGEDDGKKTVKKGPPQFAAAFALPNLSGNQRDDFVNIAKSQIGYKEAGDGSSYFGNRYGITYSAWCTCFVSWCAENAGISREVIPHVLTSRKYMEYYAPRGRFYFVEGGISPSNSVLSSYEDKMIITPSSMEPGDILLFDTDRNPSDGPDHTAIFLGMDKNGVINISGNSNDSVNITTKSLSTLHGVCKPDFEVKEQIPADVSITSVRNTKKGIKIRWDEVEGATGYEVYAKRRDEDGYDHYAQETDRDTVYDDTSFVIENLKNGEKITFYVLSYRIEEGMQQRRYCKDYEERQFVFLKRTGIRSVSNKDENSITVKWKKNRKADGYQIQYSTDSDFEDAKTVSIRSGKKNVKKITDLEEGSTYYVRIRPYRKVGDKKYYGAWKKYGEGVYISD